MKNLILLWVLGCLAVSPSFAQIVDPPIVSFSGFGTAGVVHSDANDAVFTAIRTKASGAGFEHAWSANVDSLIGAQATANFTSQWSAVLQIVSEQNYDRNYRPHAEWANVKYQLNPDFDVRVGRIALPLFLVADSRKIGYSNPWVRPPPELYSLVTFTSSDGGDASYRTRFGDTTQTLQVTAGHSVVRIPTLESSFGMRTSVEVHSLHTVVDTLENGPLTLRLSYAGSRVTIPELATLFDAFEQFGAEGQAIAQKFRVRRAPVKLFGFSVSYDPGNWFVIGEFARVYQRALLGNSTGGYTTAGYRIGQFTPYVTAAHTRAEGATSDVGLAVQNLAASLAPTAAALDGALNAVLAAKPTQTTYTIGGRWDFAKNASLKLQLDHMRLGTGSAGILVDVQPGFVPGGRVNIFSASVDFVF